jgi:replication factor C subunit 2/4
LSKLQFICEKEGLDIKKESLEHLIKVSEGDLRRSITLLQTLGRFISGTDSSEMIDDAAGVLPIAYLQKFLDSVATTGVKQIPGLVNDVLRSGYAPLQLLNQMLEIVIDDVALSPKQKILLGEKFSETEKALLDGSSARLQLLDIAMFYRNIFHQQ